MLTFFANWDETRTLGMNQSDPKDTRFQVRIEGIDPNQGIYIGGGIAKEINNTSSSVRLFVNRGTAYNQWYNTEQTVYIMRPEGDTCRSMQLRFRSNHHGALDDPYDKVGDVSCGFGNYLIKWGEHVGDDLVSIELEYIHGMYKRHIVDKTLALPYDKFVGLKGVLRNISETQVMLTGYTNLDVRSQKNWKKTIEYTFYNGAVASQIDQSTYDTESLGGGGDDRIPICNSGTPAGDGITAGTITDMRNRQVFKRPAYWNWIRLEDSQNLQLKYYSVREIIPNKPFKY